MATKVRKPAPIQMNRSFGGKSSYEDYMVAAGHFLHCALHKLEEDNKPNVIQWLQAVIRRVEQESK